MMVFTNTRPRFLESASVPKGDLSLCPFTPVVVCVSLGGKVDMRSRFLAPTPLWIRNVGRDCDRVRPSPDRSGSGDLSDARSRDLSDARSRASDREASTH
jgi:hypothetical protein